VPPSGCGVLHCFRFFEKIRERSGRIMQARSEWSWSDGCAARLGSLRQPRRRARDRPATGLQMEKAPRVTAGLGPARGSGDTGGTTPGGTGLTTSDSATERFIPATSPNWAKKSKTQRSMVGGDAGPTRTARKPWRQRWGSPRIGSAVQRFFPRAIPCADRHHFRDTIFRTRRLTH
jgi:hypothetical protein